MDIINHTYIYVVHIIYAFELNIHTLMIFIWKDLELNNDLIHNYSKQWNILTKISVFWIALYAMNTYILWFFEVDVSFGRFVSAHKAVEMGLII